MFVDSRHSLGESFAVPVYIQAQQVVMNQVQGHLTSKLRCYHRDLVGLMVGFIVKAVHGVQLSAIISVDLRLKWRNTYTDSSIHITVCLMFKTTSRLFLFVCFFKIYK